VKQYDIQPGDKVHDGDPVIVDRYPLFIRINHWITAVCFVLLTISGLAMFHPSLFFLTDLFAGGQNTRAPHPWLGVVVFVAFFGLFFRFWRSSLFAEGDLAWMLAIGDLLAGREDKVPEVGRYNPGQKMLFWSMSPMIIVLFVTGLIIWDEYFFDYTTIEHKRFAVLAHSAVAVLAICGIIVHVVMVIWERGTLQAMTRGWVTGGWAWRHHRKWLRALATDKS
jgi:formate dehydrogenase subunit gamma